MPIKASVVFIEMSEAFYADINAENWTPIETA
jgi:hypothetical protein